MDLRKQIDEAVAAVRARTDLKVDAGMILGSGLGALADAVEGAVSIPFGEIPHFPVSTVLGHKGDLVVGKMHGTPVAVMRGRIHYYEGYTLQQVTFPVRLIKALGARVMIVTNSAGGINPSFAPGDLMLIYDHLNFFGGNPLIGQNDDSFGVRFPPMAYAYDAKLRELAHRVARGQGVTLREGVYAGLTGPSFETPAEIRYFQRAGADAVGMSTVPEVIVARHGDMKVLGLSCITNILHDGPSQDTHQDVLDVAARSSPAMMAVLSGILESWEC